MNFLIGFVLLLVCHSSLSSDDCFCETEEMIVCDQNADSYSIHSLPCVRSATVLQTGALDICTFDILLLAPQIKQINVTNSATECACYCNRVTMFGYHCPTLPPSQSTAPVGLAVGISAGVLILGCIAVGLVNWKRDVIMNKIRSLRGRRLGGRRDVREVEQAIPLREMNNSIQNIRRVSNILVTDITVHNRQSLRIVNELTALQQGFVNTAENQAAWTRSHAMLSMFFNQHINKNQLRAICGAENIHTDNVHTRGDVANILSETIITKFRSYF